MESIGQILGKGGGKSGSLHYTNSGGTSFTTGPANDPRGGTFMSVSQPQGGKKTILYPNSGSPVVKQNGSWRNP